MSNNNIPNNESEPEIIFFDDFDRGKLDRKKWNVIITEKIYNKEQQAYIDSSETIYIAAADEIPGASNGALIIHPRYRPDFKLSGGIKFDFISGRIDTRNKFEFKYGSAAARMMMPSGSGLWPAFWLLGSGTWPGSGEIDIMEYVGEPDWISSALHGPGYHGEAGLVKKYTFPPKEDARTWHVYSVDWSPDSIIFKVDDLTIYSITRPSIEYFGPWVFNNNKHLILNFALGGTYPNKMNGFHTPYLGLPDETVQMVADNQVKVVVDWIRVTKNTFTGAMDRSG